MSIEQYLDMSDDELDYLIAYNKGDHIQNPWFGSSIERHRPLIDDDYIPDLTEIPIDEKFKSLKKD